MKRAATVKVLMPVGPGARNKPSRSPKGLQPSTFPNLFTRPRVLQVLIKLSCCPGRNYLQDGADPQIRYDGGNLLKQKSIVGLSRLVVISCSVLSAASAQSTRCYTNESLKGTYAVVVNYGANLALGFITETLDGAGNLRGAFRINQPSAGSTTGERSIVTGTQTGTYNVNCDGTGIMDRVVTRQDGSIANQSDDFVITSGIVQGSRLIARTILDAAREPSVVIPGGIFLTLTHTRLPNAGGRCYTLESLQGSYAVTGNYADYRAASLGTRSLDGAGNLRGSFVINQPTAASTTGQRTIVSGTLSGTYTVNCDGTGEFTRTVTLADGTTSSAMDDFLITRAVLKGDKLVATYIEDAQRVPSTVVPGGFFLTRTHTLLPNADASSAQPSRSPAEE